MFTYFQENQRSALMLKPEFKETAERVKNSFLFSIKLQSYQLMPISKGYVHTVINFFSSKVFNHQIFLDFCLVGLKLFVFFAFGVEIVLPKFHHGLVMLTNSSTSFFSHKSRKITIYHESSLVHLTLTLHSNTSPQHRGRHGLNVPLNPRCSDAHSE